MKKRDARAKIKEMTKEELCESKKKRSIHVLHVKWAVKHLALIEDCQTKLSNESNINLLDILMAMDAERQNLINSNPVYGEAQEILDSVRNINFFTNRED